jgi:hypothetical protein
VGSQPNREPQEPQEGKGPGAGVGASLGESRRGNVRTIAWTHIPKWVSGALICSRCGAPIPFFPPEQGTCLPPSVATAQAQSSAAAGREPVGGAREGVA